MQAWASSEEGFEGGSVHGAWHKDQEVGALDVGNSWFPSC
jgi:hypothetical protein